MSVAPVPEYFTTQEHRGALDRLIGVKVPRATGVLWPTQFILTVLLARLSGIGDGARAGKLTEPGRTVPKLAKFSALCN